MNRVAPLDGTSMTSYDILIVGGGHAGAHCATTLRHFGYAGTIGILTDEHELPYERPPLSKDYLSGDKRFDQMGFHGSLFWTEKQIDVLHGKRVEAVDAERHEAICSSGESYAYGKLIWAAGGRPHRLRCAGAGAKGLHVVRTREDVDRLKAELEAAQRVVVIGGGFIGLEAAASLRKLGKEVVVVEAFDRALARVTGAELSAFVTQEHRGHGVAVCLGAKVVSLSESDGRVSGVNLHDERCLPADLVVVGIGIQPSVEPLTVAGAAGENGIDVNEDCQTSLPDIYAIGDCARQSHAYAEQAMIRLESVQNALDQATLAASHIVGRPAPKQMVPWFWSIQYDLRIQMAGLSSGYDEVVVRGDRVSKSFSIVYLRGGVLIALDAVNATKDFVQGKMAIGKRVRPDRGALADTGVPLTSFY